MPVMPQVTFDCRDVPAMVRFWCQVLDYEPQPPPPGFETWEDFARAQGVPEEMWDAWGAAVDPTGKGPRFFFQRVPEAKTAKNRVHLDLPLTRRAGGGDLDAEVGRVEAIGAQRISERYEEFGSTWVVMRDPEGNEFCIT